MKLKAAGAVPGRVGKCPRCGALLRVPGAEAPRAETADEAEAEAEDEAGGYGLGPAAPSLRPSAYSAPRSKPKTTVQGNAAAERRLIPSPTRPETRIAQSLLYPLWDDSGLA